MPGPLNVNVSTRVNQVWAGRDIRASGISTLLLMNTDLVNTVKVGSDPTSIVVPVAPNGSLSVDPSSNWYVVGLVAGTAPLVVVPNGQANFLGLTQGLGSLAIPSIFSPNFITGVSGWSIQKNGNAEFNNLTIRGTFFGLDFIINSAGIFIYSGTPALGNLVGSWAPVAGSDSFTNAYQKDFTVYIANGGYVNINSSGGIGGNTAVLFNPGGTSHVTEKPQLYGASNNGTLVNEFEFLALVSGAAGGLDDTQIQLLSERADASAGAVINFLAGGTLLSQLFKTVWNIGVPISATLGTHTTPTVITTDTWTTLSAGFSNGWTISGSGVNAIRYRMNTDKSVDIEWDIINPVAVGGTSAVFTLPSGYFNPAFTRNVVCQTAVGGAGWVFISAAGVFNVVSYTVANKEIWGSYKLQLI